ncbi:MAG: hypothetical protein ETSY2_18270, partial [Candidatus Entotheonella gemina]
MSPTTSALPTNPFPGLRPFREDEAHLFFGRESQVDALVDTLANTHFLSVVGTSGSGKSSLVNCGLRPALHQGLMAQAGTAWRMAQFRPGNRPLRAMAHALAQDGVLFSDFEAAGITLAEIIEATLRMSKLGLIDIFEQARLGKDVNLLVVVDQFEELFRYQQPGVTQHENAYGISEEAVAFVNLLLEVREQAICPIYVVLTMRSDFLGDCAQFHGLPEAINAGQYLVPRLTRDERRATIRGPIAVGRADTAPMLLTRLVNDVGDNPDQLSILQHALNRTWSYWQHEAEGQGPLGLMHYDAIGTMAHALDRHAEQTYAELSTIRQQQICEKLFKALTDKATDTRGVRRPTTLGTLCALAEATEAEVTEVIDVFRQPSASFVMPPDGDTLEAETVIDISHESLMRGWKRLKTWADEEMESAAMYCRLEETARLWQRGQAGLWGTPDLENALAWKAQACPSLTWASRYGHHFELAIRFLNASEAQRDKERQKQEAARQRELAQAQALADAQQRRAEAEHQRAEEQAAATTRFRRLAMVLAAVFLLAVGAAAIARFQHQRAEIRRVEAERLRLVSGAQALAAQALSKPDELGALLARQAYRFNQRGRGHVLHQVDRALRTVLSTPHFSHILRDHRGPVYAVAFSRDGHMLASGSHDGTVRLWHLHQPHAAPRVLAAQQNHIWSIAFNPDGHTLAAGHGNGTIQLWDLRQPHTSTILHGHTGPVYAVAFSSQGHTLASGSHDATVRLWKPSEPDASPRVLDNHTGPVFSVAFSPDGGTLASGSRDRTVHLWDPQQPDASPTILTGHQGWVRAVAF